jgi:hypothetical protein
MPDEVIHIRYDSRENLMAMGIIPTHKRPSRDRWPNAFPGYQPGFVPDPR